MHTADIRNVWRGLRLLIAASPRFDNTGDILYFRLCPLVQVLWPSQDYTAKTIPVPHGRRRQQNLTPLSAAGVPREWIDGSKESPDPLARKTSALTLIRERALPSVRSLTVIYASGTGWDSKLFMTSPISSNLRGAEAIASYNRLDFRDSRRRQDMLCDGWEGADVDVGSTPVFTRVNRDLENLAKLTEEQG